MSASAVYDALVRSALAHELESAFMEATGLPVVLIQSGEPLLFFTFRGREHPFCSLMARSPVSCMACQKVHTELQQQITDNLVPQVTCCFAGLSEFAVPVIVAGQHVATLLGGPVLQGKPTQTQFPRLTQQLRTWGMKPELRRIESAFLRTHVTSRKQFQASLHLLTIFARFLAEDANRDLLAARIQDTHWISRARKFILDHAAEPLRLGDVAEHVHLSSSYFSRFFKKATGLGFSEFLARARVRNAKNSLANPGLTINEVANRAGFGSLSQFNRAFQRYVGCSPKEYRASLLTDRSLEGKST